MQINRLLEIVYILLNQKNTTAKQLAERFSVSQRTIYRDIDTLSLAGIPVYTEKYDCWRIVAYNRRTRRFRLILFINKKPY